MHVHCPIHGTGQAEPNAAELAARHNELHHRGAQVATARPTEES